MKDNKPIKLTQLQRLGMEVEILQTMEKYPEFKKRVLESLEQVRLKKEEGGQ